MRKVRRILPALLAAVLLPASHAQELAQRLILKDGSYQLVNKYEVKGDRVRYLSAERNEWEELPNSLVDWPATEKYEKERAAGASVPEAAQLDKEIEAERERAETLLPLVAPGLRLPQDSGVFMLDSFQGEAQIDELQQTAGDISHNTKGNIFRGAINPIGGMKETIELDGAHAPIQAHVEVPSLYISLDAAPDLLAAAQATPSAQQAQQPVPNDRFRIVRADVKSNKRIVGDIKRQVTGKVSQEQRFVKTTTTRLAGFLKVTPTEPLNPGEYALVEMVTADAVAGEQGKNVPKQGMNLYVWDFGVNPKAPANKNPWKPDAKPEETQKPQ